MTRDLQEAWEREVTRTVTLGAQVQGEARLRQPLDGTLPRPVLMALESLLGSDESEWEGVDGGYQRQVEGGSVTYFSSSNELEIVARVEGEITAIGAETVTEQGEVSRTYDATGEAMYYTDGYGGRNRRKGENDAREEAERRLTGREESEREELRREADREATAAERAVEERVEAAARRHAQEKLREDTSRARSRLDEEARGQLGAIGRSGRQAFNEVLGRAYRDVLLAYARRRNAQGVRCEEHGDTIEIEFLMER